MKGRYRGSVVVRGRDYDGARGVRGKKKASSSSARGEALLIVAFDLR